MDENPNYFRHATAAQRYARNRPYFHPLVTRKIRDYLGSKKPLDRALDVACGTGQSATALTAIAGRVIGTDISAEMLAQAVPHTRIEYMQSPAETIPLPDAHFDLITVSLAFHWFDRERFLAEANRLLLPNGWLVISNNYFTGIMQENPGFNQWNRERYLRRFPTPSRRNQPLTDDDAKKSGFCFAHRETYANDVQFTADEVAGYLMTQSNVIAAVEQGTTSSERVYEWLFEELSLLMSDHKGTFAFAGYIWFLRKADTLR